MRPSPHRAWFVLAAAVLMAAPARADLIYQSATPVVTSTTNDTGANGVDADTTFFSGVNFQLTSTTQITSIGGHFGNLGVTGNNEIFGALVAVTSLTAPPASTNLSSGVLASTLIALPANGTSTNTLAGSVNVTLGPGFYAVLFGSGLFGATGSGLAIENVTSPTFTGAVNTGGVVTYALRQSDGTQFLQAAGARYFVTGTVVPEPSSLVLVAVGLSGLGIVAARRRSGPCAAAGEA